MKKELKSEPRPADYFELAGGTSTGGIIGIMLFRLHMTASQAIEEYDMIAKDVFSPKIYGWDITKVFGQTVSGWINNSKTVVQSSRFDDKHLESAINRVVAKYGLDENDKKLRGNALLRHPKAGKMYVEHAPTDVVVIPRLTTRPGSSVPQPRTGPRPSSCAPTRTLIPPSAPRRTTS